jgi:hypothetical protein
MLQALRIRDFRLLWAGRLVSSLGSWPVTPTAWGTPS